MESIRIRNFMEIPYDELEELNLRAKRQMLERMPADVLREQHLKYLTDEKQLKAVTVCFSDVEGRFHMLDYDKKFLIRSHDNLTFDGSSIHGFTPQRESDLRLAIDWASFRWLPSDVFGPGKVMVFGLIQDRDGSDYVADLRTTLKRYCDGLAGQRMTVSIAPEIEGFLFKGLNAEQEYTEAGFEFVSEGGYFHSLPTAPLKLFIDRFAEAQRALGFENEKDHPEVAPSQFELTYAHCDALVAADQVQIYKLLARQIAAQMGFTASFLPKPRCGINGSGMHTNLSVSREGKNLFYDQAGQDGLSQFGWSAIDRILDHAEELCLILNPSVNAYRRLDPRFEAPNQICASAVNRAAMIRIPIGNERSMRLEIRSVAPDANPYMTFLALARAAIEPSDSPVAPGRGRDSRDRTLPKSLQEAISAFENGTWMTGLLGPAVHRRYADLKKQAAARCPAELGTRIKPGEIRFHHEVTNQQLWAEF